MDFNAEAGKTPEPKQTDTTNPLEALVGDGKPFKDLEALATAKVESDNFIEQLKSENFEMRQAVKDMEDKLARASTTTEILEAVRSMSTRSGEETTQTSRDEPNESGNQPGITENNIEEMIQRTMAKQESERKAADNYELVKATFLEKFKDPDKARLQYKAAAVALEMTEEQLDMYAKQNPHLVLRAAGIEPTFKSTSTPPSYIANKVNSEAGTTETVRDHSWWEQQRKAKGNTWYFSPKVQQMYWNDANALGDKFLP